MRKLLRHLRFLVAVQLLPALESGEETLVGGQAVLEGVMMRGERTWAIAVRTPEGAIEVVTHEAPTWAERWKMWKNLPKGNHSSVKITVMAWRIARKS